MYKVSFAAISEYLAEEQSPKGQRRDPRSRLHRLSLVFLASAHFNQIFTKALLPGPATFLVLRAVLFCLLVLACLFVKACSVAISAATCLIREIDWPSLIQAIRKVPCNHWRSVDLAAAGVNVAPILVTPLWGIGLQAVWMTTSIPCCAGTSSFCWIICSLALCHYGIHHTSALVNADAAAVPHAPSKAVKFETALAKEFLTHALVT